MDLSSISQTITEAVKKTKTDWVATEPENPDIAIYLHFFRGEKLAAVVQCPVDRDTALDAARVAAAGFSADVMSMAFESYHSTLTESPITGEPWRHQEMQFVHETYPQASEEGWVDSCISVATLGRENDYVFSSLPYRLKDGVVTWLEDQEMIVESAAVGAATGFMQQSLQEVMSKPKLEELLAKQIGANYNSKLNYLLGGEERVFHADMAVYRVLKERSLCTTVLFAVEEGSEREQWFKDRLGADHLILVH